jgi:uncharacterized protein (DUF2132 family)
MADTSGFLHSFRFPLMCIFVQDMPGEQKNNPLHGKTLEFILQELVAYYGYEKLGAFIPINCFRENPGIPSSLKFLRKTPWARKKVEELYIQISERTSGNGSQNQQTE